MENLKENLDSYKLQLTQINEALSINEDPEMHLLRDDLLELIELTTQSLLDYEKSKLMAICDEDQYEVNCDGKEQSGNVEDELASFYAELDAGQPSTSNQHLDQKFNTISKWDHNRDLNSKNSDFLKTIEKLDDITGIKCQAPHTTEWSGVNYHNAMVMSFSGEGKDITVKVLFLNPTMVKMQTCSQFLDHDCNYSDTDCKYNHGHSVSLYSLRTFKEPDFTELKPSSECLAKLPNGLWSYAVLEQIIDGEKFLVKFRDNRLTCELEAQHIYPFVYETSNVNTNEKQGGKNEVTEKTTDFHKQPNMVEETPNLKGLGGWEKHTNGFGSRIMMKHGYNPGEGLGKNGQGRIEPVEVVVLPHGKSLDYCMMSKEKKKMFGTERPCSSASVSKPKPNVFNFLNNVLGKTSNPNKKEVHLAAINKTKDPEDKKKAQNNVLIKNDLKIRELNARIRKLNGSINRNKETNPSVAKKLRVELSNVNSQLNSLKSTNNLIQMGRKRDETHRKMTKF